MRERDVVVRRALALVALVIGIAGTACGGGGDSTAPPSEKGIYNLQSVNNQSLPVTFTGTALGNVVITNATLTLTDNSAYSATFAGTVNGVATPQLLSDAGTYARSNSTITFTSTTLPGFGYAGALSGSQLSVSVPGAAFGIAGSLNLLLQRQ